MKVIAKNFRPLFLGCLFCYCAAAAAVCYIEEREFCVFQSSSLLHAKTTSPVPPSLFSTLLFQLPRLIFQISILPRKRRRRVGRGQCGEDDWNERHQIMCVRAKFANPSVLKVGKSSSHVMSFLNYRSRLGGKIIRENSNFASSLFASFFPSYTFSYFFLSGFRLSFFGVLAKAIPPHTQQLAGTHNRPSTPFPWRSEKWKKNEI